MTQANAVNITSPVGRIVAGDLYKPNTKAMDGSPLLVKTGANIGQPRVDFYFALAIPKGTEKAWWDTTWGQQILAVGAASFPQAYQRPDFAWKITDGDSTVPNKRGKMPAKQEGYAGNWVLKFSGGFAPKIFRVKGPNQVEAILEPNAVKCGYYVEVAFSVAGNNQANNPGVYLNHQMVALAGYGPEIFSGPDPESAGFGQAPLPPGASATPIAGAAAIVPTAAPGPVAHTMTAKAGGATYEAMIAAGWTDATLLSHGMMVAPVAAAPAPSMPPAPVAAIAPPPASAVPALPVAPNPAILTPPGATTAAPPPPAAPSAPAAPAARTMLPKAAGTPYEAFIAQGWTDANLVAHGYMAA